MSPFEDDDDILEQRPGLKGLKKISSQASVFDNAAKKPSNTEFKKRVNEAEHQMSEYKRQGSELARSFDKLMDDKTLAQNKTVFMIDLEREVLSKMVDLAVTINNDELENEGMGSIMWIVTLLKNSFKQRNKINELEYEIFQLKKLINEDSLNKIISQRLDNCKKSE